MTLVRIVKNWQYPDLSRQTPNCKGVWDGIEFTEEAIAVCDYLVVLNCIPENLTVKCPKENVFAILQDPYYEDTRDWITKEKYKFSKIFTHFIPTKDTKYIQSHPCLPWHIKRTYDELVKNVIPEKSKAISWISSNKKDLAGQRKRMSFLQALKKDTSLSIDLFGKGINFIDDKWDGLAPYKYSIAIENTYSEDYWTEKIADCFLAYTLPIYYGCPNLEKYYPKNSFIRIDIDDPQGSLDKITEILETDPWEKHLSAIQQARELFLKKYHFFPYFADYINSIKDKKTTNLPKELVIIERYKMPLRNIIRRKATNLINKFK